MITNRKGRILLVDNQPSSLKGLSAVLSGDGYDVIPSRTLEHASTVVDNHDLDAVITDVGLSDSNGLRLFEYATAARPGIPVILLTDHKTIDAAITSMTRGAFYYFIKPPEYPQLKSILARAVEQHNMKREIKLLKDRLSDMSSAYRIIGNHPEILKMTEIMEAVRESPGNVLISGEPGTGKEFIARTMHCHSFRSTEPFVAVNCAAIPAEFIEAELFGCGSKPFIGSPAHRRGRIEEAGNGVIFLEEIDQLGPGAQERLLKLLGDGSAKGNGGNEKAAILFRLISTTIRDLSERVTGDGFNGELYRRISEIEIKVPPLRQRKDDIPLLASTFLDEFCIKQKRRLKLSSEVMRALQYHDWPGNVRQLKNVVERAVILAGGGKITLRELPDEFLAPKKRPLPRMSARTLKQLEMQAIRETLTKCNGNKSRTARMLGISRKAFYKRLREADQFNNV